MLRFLNRKLRAYGWSNHFGSNFADWLSHKLSYFRGLIERTTEVILFIPVILKVVRWDHSSIFIILHHWLKRMEEVHRQDSIHLGSEDRANEIHTCVLLLERITKNEYEEKLYEEHDKRWGESKFWFTPSPNEPGYSIYNSTRSNIKSEEDKKLEYKERVQLIHHAKKQEKQDIEFLFNLIKKHYPRWWT